MVDLGKQAVTGFDIRKSSLFADVTVDLLCLVEHAQEIQFLFKVDTRFQFLRTPLSIPTLFRATARYDAPL
jgi:hypothetical protein